MVEEEAEQRVRFFPLESNDPFCELFVDEECSFAGEGMNSNNRVLETDV